MQTFMKIFGQSERRTGANSSFAKALVSCPIEADEVLNSSFPEETGQVVHLM